MNQPTSMLVEVVHASISPKISSISTDPLARSTIYSGTCRRLEIDASIGELRAKPEYYTLWNGTSGSLAAGDVVLATPIEDEDGELVLITL